MKNLLQFLFLCILLINCKGETKDTFKKAVSTNVQKKQNDFPTKNKNDDCYNYLTEMVRSSTFPLTHW